MHTWTTFHKIGIFIRLTLHFVSVCLKIVVVISRRAVDKMTYNTERNIVWFCIESKLCKDTQNINNKVTKVSSKHCIRNQATKFNTTGSNEYFTESWLGKLATNYTQSGSRIYQGKPSLPFLEHVLRVYSFYGCETWTMRKALQDRIDGTYTRLLMRVPNIS